MKEILKIRIQKMTKYEMIQNIYKKSEEIKISFEDMITINSILAYCRSKNVSHKKFRVIS